jgi:RNA polymerase sigma-70 factor (ECF subfamily)
MDRSARDALQSGMQRLADGDRGAFDAVFSSLWPLLRGFALRALRDSAEADDAAQGALVKVFARAAEFDPKRDALAWALAIATYECRTLRKRKLRRREDPGDPPEETSPSPEDAVIEADLRAAAGELCGALDPVDAETLLAAARGERPNTPVFRKRLERALARLRKQWRARHGTD